LHPRNKNTKNEDKIENIHQDCEAKLRMGGRLLSPVDGFLNSAGLLLVWFRISDGCSKLIKEIGK
jgi:hypothetical protein